VSAAKPEIRYAALLRAVIVGGHNTLAMSELCEVLTALGLSSVTTYLRSFSVLGHINAMEQTLALSATSRNWNTVQKLAALTRAETGS
jgi:uncharacterized protein (DUF1697 family)